MDRKDWVCLVLLAVIFIFPLAYPHAYAWGLASNGKDNSIERLI